MYRIDQYGKTTFMRDLPDPRVQVELTTLISLAAQAKAVQLQLQHVRTGQTGSYLSTFKGRGIEFDEVRLYQAGDDVRNIDWRVTARRGDTYTKIFREERERPVFISVDQGRTMQFATRGVFKSVQAAKLAALIAWAAQMRGDRIGGQVFTKHFCQEMKPQAGKRGVLRLLNLLAAPVVKDKIVIDHWQVLARLNQHVKPGSSIYLIGDFRSLTTQDEWQLRKWSQHCQLTLILVYDPLEQALPANGYYRFVDQQREVMIDTRDKSRLNRYHATFEQRLHSLHQLAQKLAVNLIFCTTTQNPLECLR